MNILVAEWLNVKRCVADRLWDCPLEMKETAFKEIFSTQIECKEELNPRNKVINTIFIP